MCRYFCFNVDQQNPDPDFFFTLVNRYFQVLKLFSFVDSIVFMANLEARWFGPIKADRFYSKLYWIIKPSPQLPWFPEDLWWPVWCRGFLQLASEPPQLVADLAQPVSPPRNTGFLYRLATWTHWCSNASVFTHACYLLALTPNFLPWGRLEWFATVLKCSHQNKNSY